MGKMESSLPGFQTERSTWQTTGCVRCLELEAPDIMVNLCFCTLCSDFSSNDKSSQFNLDRVHLQRRWQEIESSRSKHSVT